MGVCLSFKAEWREYEWFQVVRGVWGFIYIYEVFGALRKQSIPIILWFDLLWATQPHLNKNSLKLFDCLDGQRDLAWFGLYLVPLMDLMIKTQIIAELIVKKW